MKQTFLMLLLAMGISFPVLANDYLLQETFSNVTGSDESPSALDQSQFDNPTGWTFTNAFAGKGGVILKKGGTITLPAVAELTGNATFFFSGNPWFAPEDFEREENFGPHQVSIVNGDLNKTEYDMMTSMSAPMMYGVGPETRVTLTASYDMKITGAAILYGNYDGWDSAVYTPKAGTYYEPFDLTVEPCPDRVFGDDGSHNFAVFTLDGSTPTRTSQRVSNPIHIDKTTTIRVATILGNGAMVVDQPMTFTLEGAAEVPDVPVNSFEVTVSAPGNLKEQLLSLDADVIEGLVLKGKINGTDIAYINKGTGMMGSLEYLNMKDVVFDYDGSPYATIVFAPEGGMGTVTTLTYRLSESNYSEGWDNGLGNAQYDCYSNNLAGAFYKHPKLKHIVLPSFLTSIGGRAFEMCEELVALEHDGPLTEVGDMAFYCAPKLSNFNFKGVKKLGINSFAGSDIKGKLDISSCEEIGDGTFADCKITSVVFNQTSPFKIGESAFAGTKIENLDLPTPPDTIPAHAFNIADLKRVNIGNGLKYIGAQAFGSNVEEMTLPETIEEVGSGAISNKVLANIPDEDGIKYIAKAAYMRTGDQSAYNIKEGTVSLTNGLFSWSNTESVTLPSSVRVIGSEAFAGSRLKTTPDMPGVVGIKYGAFRGCTDMTKAILPETLEHIGLDVFSGNTALWNLQFNCINVEAEGPITDTSIEKITVGPKVKKIPQGLYTANNNITSIDLPASVEIIGEKAFCNCSNLKSVNIPGRIKSMGESAFENCMSLTDIAPLDVEVIPDNTFRRCENLENIWLSDRTKVIGNGAFDMCYKLHDIHWPINLHEIGLGAFWSCKSLDLVSLPEGVQRVGNSAFHDCESLKTVYIPSTLIFDADFDSYECFAFMNEDMGAAITCMLPEPPAIKDYYWNFNNRVAQIKVPGTSLEAYKQHPDWKALADIIVSIEGVGTISENSSTSFNSGIDENTDLGDTTVGDVYVTLGEEDGYDLTDGAIVLGSTMDEEYAGNVGGLVPGKSDIANRFNGLVVSVADGRGKLSIDCRTIGENLLSVKIGTAEPQSFVKDEKGFVEVDYNVAEPTCIYIYGSKQNNPQQISAKKMTSRVSSENCIRIYAVNVNHGGNSVEEIIGNDKDNSPILDYFTIDGRKIDRPSAPGIYIIHRSNGVSEKIYLK